uniref:Uncharacterized protein n=1 Tax=Rhodnius prolixus TaxID=13249 RepID=T1HWG8_RHOPR
MGAQVTLNVLDGPVEVTTPEIIDKIHDMVMDDRRVKVREIASAVGISNERVKNGFFCIVKPNEWKNNTGFCKTNACILKLREFPTD